MLFSSITFLYFFLPLTILLYYLVPDKSRNFVLFVMSVVFYAWGEPVYVAVMLMQIVISYVLTWLTDIFENTYNNRKAGRIFYILSVLLPFGALFYYKYFDFFMINIFGKDIGAKALPIGISFYTFQITSYCIDVYYGRVKRQRNFITYAAYVTLFPQLVAGPIVRYADIERTLVDGVDMGHIREKFSRGIVRFTVGLGKKVLIANVIGEFVMEVAALEQRTVVLSWAYAIAVSLQIYFDFSGYSDMAIGLGAMLGFDFTENFRYPFISKSVSEFWRRWHISLGAWFRDYVYIPMGGNRGGFGRWIFNILVVWLFTGLWHGAGWNFIVWGLYFAVFLVVEKLNNQSEIGGGKRFIRKLLGHVYVVIVVMVSFLIFNADSLNEAWEDISGLLKFGGSLDVESFDSGLVSTGTFVLKNRIGILVIGIVGATPVPRIVWEFLREKIKSIGLVKVVTVLYVLAMFILCTAYIIDGSFNPFLYFRF